MNENLVQDLQQNKNLRHLYIGNSRPFENAEKIDLEQLPFFKAPAKFYQKFDVVWYDFIGSKDHINWRTILDEMVRMIGKEGRIALTIEVNNNAKVCYNYQRILANVKMHLFRRIGLKCDVEYENPQIYKSHCRNQNLKAGDKVVTIFKITRQNIDIYQNRSWTFALITDGSKVDNVVQFCRSIRNHDKKFEHEILICGPQNLAYDEYKVAYIDHTKYRNDYAEICKKKNDLAVAALNQNLLIAHDRFILGEDFFAGFEKFGYDFDFIAPRIIDQNGNENDCWFLLGKNIFDKSVLNFGDFFDATTAMVAKDYNHTKGSDLSYSFLSGGCLIFKRDILRKIKFNDLIFWHQIEDWEIAAQFINHGILPQMNRESSVKNLRSGDVSEKIIKKSLIKKLRKSLSKKLLKLAFIIKN